MGYIVGGNLLKSKVFNQYPQLCMASMYSAAIAEALDILCLYVTVTILMEICSKRKNQELQLLRFLVLKGT